MFSLLLIAVVAMVAAATDFPCDPDKQFLFDLNTLPDEEFLRDWADDFECFSRQNGEYKYCSYKTCKANLESCCTLNDQDKITPVGQGCVITCDVASDDSETKSLRGKSVTATIDVWDDERANCKRSRSFTISRGTNEHAYDWCGSTLNICTTSADNAEDVHTALYYWNCKGCHTSGATPGDFYEKAPWVFDQCCESCKRIIDELQLNTGNTGEFLICGGCEEDLGGDTYFLSKLTDFLVRENKPPLTNRDLSHYTFNGLIEGRVEFLGSETTQQLKCNSTMILSQEHWEVKNFNCEACSNDNTREECCQSCENSATSREDTEFVFCDEACGAVGNNHGELTAAVVEEFHIQFDDANFAWNRNRNSNAALSMLGCLLFAALL